MTNEDSAQELARKTAKSIVEHGSVPMANLKETVAMQDKLDELLEHNNNKPEVQKVHLEGVSLVTIKGDKGDKGDEPADERLESLILPLIPEPVKGDKGDVGERGEKGDKGNIGASGKDGLNGKNGTDGKDGQNGKDGSSDTGEDIVSKINELGDDDKLKIDASHIKNLPEMVKNHSQGSGLRNVAHDSTLTGTGTQDNPLSVVGGAGSGDVVGPASAVDGNVAMFDTTTGKLIKDSGLTLSGSNTGDQTLPTIGGSAGEVLVSSGAGNASAITNFAIEDAVATINIGTGIKPPRFINADGSIVLTDSGVGANLTLINTGTADRTQSFQDATGTVALLADITGTNSGTNTGDNATNTQYSGLVTNATHTGDATGSGALTVVALNGTNLAGLATGILKNTTTTGVPSIALNSDLPAMSATVGGAVPTPPNNTTTFLRGDGTFAAPAGSGDMVLASTQTNSGAKTFLATTLLLRNVADTFSSLFTNTATAARTWTLQDRNGTLADDTDLALKANLISPVFTTPNIGSATGSISGNAATVTTNANLSGPVTSIGNATAIADSALSIAKTSGLQSALDGKQASGSYITSGGALGTPSSATLTNATGLPIAGLVASTTQAIGVGSIELGHASDTTLARSAAGDLAVEGVSVLTTSNTKTVTGKRIQPRTASSTTSSNLSPDLSTANVYFRTTQTATLTIDAPTGTPIIGETIIMYIDSVGAQTLTINATYVVFGAAFPATTTAGKTFMMSCQYTGSVWRTTWANQI